MTEYLKLKKHQHSQDTSIQREESTRFDAGSINEELVFSCLKLASKKLSPLWDIRDYVAVNPFFGFKESSFIETAEYLQKLVGQNIMPKKAFFLQKYRQGEITDFDIEHAKRKTKAELESLDFGLFTKENLLSFIQKPEEKSSIPLTSCISDVYDITNHSSTTDIISKEVSKWASAYFDETMAIWRIPTQKQSFYSWWLNLVRFDKPFVKNSKLPELVQNLPTESEKALIYLTSQLSDQISLNFEELTNYFYRLLFSVQGWASYITRFEFEAVRTGDRSILNKIGGLIDLLVIRLAYDVSLLNEKIKFDGHENTNDDHQSFERLCSYIWLNAAEHAYRRRVEEQIRKSLVHQVKYSEPDVQMAFCIDVRSEVIRRKLELESPLIKTIGFAGFFGLPVSMKGLGHVNADQNCPVLLNSQHEVSEDAGRLTDELHRKKTAFARDKYLTKAIQGSANAGFSFVETFGLSYVKKLISADSGKKKPNIDLDRMGLSDNELKSLNLNTSSLGLDEKTTLAYGALKNMGLTKDFAKFVFFFGHGSESANNPYASALDCGACAGHNGKSNAKLLALLLNDEQVRESLRIEGIFIPHSTLFLSGWHNTTTDELVIDEIKNLSTEEKDQLKEYQFLFNQASEKCREERAKKLFPDTMINERNLESELSRKAENWSEIRPEWGLARNASFIVGRREMTRNLDLDGRSFLHDYDAKRDHDLSILELIMTAPMIVTNWINMQYYASTVDPVKYGTGNKVLNNVTGGIGCVQGNGSDLLGGLSEQSVWYKGEYFHEPIRLQVYIEAERTAIEKIIEKHAMVKDLIENNWLRVIAIDSKNKEFHLYPFNSHLNA